MKTSERNRPFSVPLYRNAEREFFIQLSWALVSISETGIVAGMLAGINYTIHRDRSWTVGLTVVFITVLIGWVDRK